MLSNNIYCCDEIEWRIIKLSPNFLNLDSFVMPVLVKTVPRCFICQRNKSAAISTRAHDVELQTITSSDFPGTRLHYICLRSKNKRPRHTVRKSASRLPSLSPWIKLNQTKGNCRPKCCHRHGNWRMVKRPPRRCEKLSRKRKTYDYLVPVINVTINCQSFKLNTRMEIVCEYLLWYRWSICTPR